VPAWIIYVAVLIKGYSGRDLKGIYGGFEVKFEENLRGISGEYEEDLGSKVQGDLRDIVGDVVGGGCGR
jgi:hypothetical protein